MRGALPSLLLVASVAITAQGCLNEGPSFAEQVSASASADAGTPTANTAVAKQRIPRPAVAPSAYEETENATIAESGVPPVAEVLPHEPQVPTGSTFRRPKMAAVPPTVAPAVPATVNATATATNTATPPPPVVVTPPPEEPVEQPQPTSVGSLFNRNVEDTSGSIFGRKVESTRGSLFGRVTNVEPEPYVEPPPAYVPPPTRYVLPWGEVIALQEVTEEEIEAAQNAPNTVDSGVFVGIPLFPNRQNTIFGTGTQVFNSGIDIGNGSTGVLFDSGNQTIQPQGAGINLPRRR